MSLIQKAIEGARANDVGGNRDVPLGAREDRTRALVEQITPELFVNKTKLLELKSLVEDVSVSGDSRSRETAVQSYICHRYLGQLNIELEELRSAEDHLRKALETARKLYTERSIEYAIVLNYFGVLLQRKGMNRDAVDALKTSWKLLLKESTGKRASEVMIYLDAVEHNFFSLLRIEGRIDELEKYERKSNELAESARNGVPSTKKKKKKQPRAGGDEADLEDADLGKSWEELMEGVTIVDVVDHLSSLLRDQFRTDHIEVLYRAVLRGEYGTYPKVDTQRILVRLALLLSEDREGLDEATILMEKALILTEEVYGKQHVEVALVAADLASLKYRRGDVDSAEALYTRSLKLFRSLDFPHPKEEVVMSNLAALWKQKEKRHQARNIARVVLAMDSRWLFRGQDARDDVSYARIAATVTAGIRLEESKDRDVSWMNWRGNERIKALIVYSVEVLRDASADYVPELSPKYLALVLLVHEYLGESSAHISSRSALDRSMQNSSVASGIVVRVNSGNRSSNRSTGQNESGVVTELRDRRRRKRDKDAAAKQEAVEPESLGHTSRHVPSMSVDLRLQKSVFNPDVSVHAFLKEFFQVYAPEKTEKNIEDIANRFEGRMQALVEVLESKYNVVIHPDGTFEPLDKDLGAEEETDVEDTDKHDQRADAKAEDEQRRTKEERDREKRAREMEEKKIRQEREKREKENHKSKKANEEKEKPVKSKANRKRRNRQKVLNDDVSLREVLIAFYSLHAPERVSRVDTVIETFKGREKQLFAVMKKKYGVKFRPDGTFYIVDGNTKVIIEEHSRERADSRAAGAVILGPPMTREASTDIQ